jgi:very-short-patch-repair endonuclease
MRKLTTPNAHQLSRLQQHARSMRASPTRSEEVLWRAIRGRQLGVQFRRQVVIGNFIVDFFAAEAHLIVEVDGAYHARRKLLDAQRDRVLSAAGYRILRLHAELVLTRCHEALAQVVAALR